ncbi:hypothetical protein ND2E_0965 [Colwellia psychrerythraea]|uniref:Uncharacterized protein n=1 Tax=Colwellia psychrerythraea TaxID=28229 RepID=A0A099K6F9_COLPS|nr:hypothetical protein ND2E_0965 [Colwellia psychrerythraea]
MYKHNIFFIGLDTHKAPFGVLLIEGAVLSGLLNCPD